MDGSGSLSVFELLAKTSKINNDTSSPNSTKLKRTNQIQIVFSNTKIANYFYLSYLSASLGSRTVPFEAQF